MGVGGRNIGILLLRALVGVFALIVIGLLSDMAGREGFQTVALVVLIFGVPIVAVVAFVVYVWPTMWRYEKIGETVARIRRYDGTTEVLTPRGWERMPG